MAYQPNYSSKEQPNLWDPLKISSWCLSSWSSCVGWREWRILTYLRNGGIPWYALYVRMGTCLSVVIIGECIVLSNILFKYLLPYAERKMGQYHCRFMCGKSKTDQIFSLRGILEKVREYVFKAHHVFIDVRSAYNWLGWTVQGSHRI